MSKTTETFSKSKPCFGQYENWDNSWHCKGCPISDECKSKAKENLEGGDTHAEAEQG